jgi:transcriptional regulator with XRE-family HTH domain
MANTKRDKIYATPNKNLLANIKYLASRRGMTIADVAEKTGIAKPTIYKWNAQIPSVTRLQEIASFFNVTIDDLLKSQDELENNKTTSQNVQSLDNTDNIIIDVSELNEEDRDFMEKEIFDTQRLVMKIIKKRRNLEKISEPFDDVNEKLSADE